LFDSQSIYVDGKQTLLLSVVIVSAIYAAYYVVTCANNHKLQEKAIYHKDWRIVQYDRDNPICIREHDMYYACVRAVNGNGLCAYAICMECYDKNKPKRKRGSKEKTACRSNTEKHEKCCHRLFDLEVTRDPWWCGKAYRHTDTWEGRISGCICCEREFLKVGGKG